MAGTLPAVTSPAPGHPMFHAQRRRQHRSLCTRIARSTNWMLPEDLRSVAALLLDEADRREFTQRRPNLRQAALTRQMTPHTTFSNPASRTTTSTLGN
jgi:hypothetical protein